MRLKAEGAPDATDRRVAEPRMLRHVTRAPVRRALGFGFESIDDDALDLGVGDLPWSAGARLVMHALKSELRKARAPASHRIAVELHFGGDGGALAALGTTQHDAGSQRERLRRLTASRIALENLAL